jgi:Uma2 family endonuclease
MSLVAIKETAPKSPLKKLTWEEFERRYSKKEDRYKYEWVSGEVIKTLRTMNQLQLFILDNLLNLLDGLRTANPNLGKLYSEINAWFGDAYRRPDIAYFTSQQVKASRDANQVPQFVVEVISNNDQLNKANEKLIDYRNAKVPIVWFVYPKIKEVHVYRGKQMTICTGDDICSAEPVIPGFLIAANAVFE